MKGVLAAKDCLLPGFFPSLCHARGACNQWQVAVYTSWMSSRGGNIVQVQGFLQHDKPKLTDLLPQICGGKLRWQLYHEVHLVERCAKRLHGTAQLGQPAVAPGGPGWHPLNAHVAALLPSLLRLTRCLHAAWSPQACPLPMYIVCSVFSASIMPHHPLGASMRQCIGVCPVGISPVSFIERPLSAHPLRPTSLQG